MWITVTAETATSQLKKSWCWARSALYPPAWRGGLLPLPNKDNPRKEENTMSRMSDMAQTIEELRSAAAAITDVANWLSQQFSSDAEEAPITEAQPEKKPELTLEQVRAVLADKSRAGHTAAVRELLQKYGAAKLSQVDPKHYEALMKDAEVISNAT